MTNDQTPPAPPTAPLGAETIELPALNAEHEAETGAMQMQIDELQDEIDRLRAEVDRRAERTAELSLNASAAQTEANSQRERAEMAETRERLANETIQQLHHRVADREALTALLCRIAVDTDGVLRVPGLTGTDEDDEDNRKVRALVRDDRSGMWREIQYTQTGEVAEAIDAIMRLRHQHDEPIDAEVLPWWDDRSGMWREIQHSEVPE